MALYKDKPLQRSKVKNQRIWYKLITQKNKYYRRRGRDGRFIASPGIYKYFKITYGTTDGGRAIDKLHEGEFSSNR